MRSGGARRRWLWVWWWACLCAAIRLLAGGLLAGRDPAAMPIVSICLDPNRASIAELSALPGIGRVRAHAIVVHRIRHGPFRNESELALVDGIGAETVAGLRPFLQLDAPAPPVRNRGAPR